MDLGVILMRFMRTACLLVISGYSVCSRCMLMFGQGGGLAVIVIVQLQSFHYLHHYSSSLISSFFRGIQDTFGSYSLNQWRFLDLRSTIRPKACLINLYSISILFLEPIKAKTIKKGMNRQIMILQTRTRFDVEMFLDQKKRATMKKKKNITMAKQEARALQMSENESQQQSSGFPSKCGLWDPIFLHIYYLTSSSESRHSPSSSNPNSLICLGNFQSQLIKQHQQLPQHIINPIIYQLSW